jgi:hypothetical protein
MSKGEILRLHNFGTQEADFIYFFIEDGMIITPTMIRYKIVQKIQKQILNLINALWIKSFFFLNKKSITLS